MYRLLTILIASVCLSGGLAAQQDTVLFADDPVAAMLDSLAHNRYILSIPHQVTAHANKYHYAPDSIPVADAVTIEGRLARLNAQSPFDLVYNDEVQTYINMYVMKKRALVERMLGLSQLYYPIFEEQLDKYNLPLELKHLAVIESALNPSATSRVGARGLWQFMYTTGKVYHLEVTSYVDERCDPYKSTIAACECLKDLYAMFGDWQMVLAAYNAGPGAVNKAIRRAGGGKLTYWQIRPYLPRETQAYVPAFIAANYAMTYAPEHNLYPVAPRKAFFDVDTVAVKQQVNFSQLEAILGTPYDELEFLNPMYKLGVIPYSFEEPYSLILPNEKVGTFVTNEQKIYDYVKTDSAMTSMEIQQVKVVHVVKKGETITTISRRYKCSVSDIRAWNNLKSNYLKPGQRLTIYTPERIPASGQTQPVATQETAPQKPPAQQPAQQTQPQNQKPQSSNGGTTQASSGGTQYKYYTVKKGDSLWKIANDNGTTVDELKKLNGYGSKYSLVPGQKIKVGVVK